MEFIEVSAKNVEDAITEACQKLGVTSDQIEYEVIDKGSSGFLGIGSKNAVIKACKKASSDHGSGNNDASNSAAIFTSFCSISRNRIMFLPFSFRLR